MSHFYLLARHLDKFVFDFATKKDINASTSHVGGDGNRALSTSFGNDDCFLLVELRVQNVVGNAMLKGFRKVFAAIFLKAPFFETPVEPWGIDD